MTLFQAIVPLLLFSAVADAGVFSYRDEKGTLHAVSSPDEIPPQFRGKEIGRAHV